MEIMYLYSKKKNQYHVIYQMYLNLKDRFFILFLPPKQYRNNLKLLELRMDQYME